MSKRKDRERAAKEGPYRNAKPGYKLIKCIYPPCLNRIEIPEPGPILNISKPQAPPFCRVHLEMLQFVLWVLPQVQIQRGTTPSGITIPGGDKKPVDMKTILEGAKK